MLDENLRSLPLEELLKLLDVSQRNFTTSKLKKQGADVIQRNKNHLEKVQKIVAAKQNELVGRS